MEQGEALDEQPAQPRWVSREDVPARVRHFFDVAPVLAVHDGPWSHHRWPRLGAALQIFGWVIAGLIVAAIIVDQRRADTFLDGGNKIAAGFVVALLALILVAGPGAFASRGRVRYRPSGRKLADSQIKKYRGNVTSASSIHGLLSSDDADWRKAQGAGAGWREIQAALGHTPSTGRLIISLYWSDRDDYALAAVHLEEDDSDEIAVWPPVTIPPDLVGKILPWSSSHASYPLQS